MSKHELRQAWANISAEVVRLAAREPTRREINALYRRLSFRDKARCHRLFAKLFRKLNASIDEGEWTVDFVEKTIKLPITPQRMWLDWDCALSVLGHEPEIKKTYANLIQSSERPDLFVDVGANYGTHSVLFLSHAIETMSFEPNHDCHAYFQECCLLNGTRPMIIGIALGDTDSLATLSFPRNDTWLGTLSAEVSATFQGRSDLQREIVSQAKLDYYLLFHQASKMLIKIDTEGSEYSVLCGAAHSVERHRPFIIFESHKGPTRQKLLRFFRDMRYRVCPLPWNPKYRRPQLGTEWFVDSDQRNFIALPVEK